MVKQVTEWIAEDGTRRWRSTDLTHASGFFLIFS